MKFFRTSTNTEAAFSPSEEAHLDFAETASQGSIGQDSCSSGKGIRRNKNAKRLSGLEVLKQARPRRHGRQRHGRCRGHMLFN